MEFFLLGVDIGSTTEKVVLTDKNGVVKHTAYIRHNTLIAETLLALLNDIKSQFGNIKLKSAFTGSAGMRIAENANVLFVQEIIAAGNATHRLYKGVKSLIDIGGEDAKLVLFSDKKRPDIRMNGNCAGGTGAYIDQMATLLNVNVNELNALAYNAKKIYPIASRCGVFAKTDVQNLISRKIEIADIAASIFHAVASQTINSLARGCDIESKLLFCGGPLNYIAYLRKAFLDLLHLQEEESIVPERAELFTALGTAFSAQKSQTIHLTDLLENLSTQKGATPESENTLPPLFTSENHFKEWTSQHKVIQVPEKDMSQEEVCFLGIDSGSTTTKIVITDPQGAILYKYYANNNGKPLETVVEGLSYFSKKTNETHKKVLFQGAAVTGYGEDLIKSALGLDYGLVETISHFLAAQNIEPEVSFILDIGGQDIKAIYIQNATITNIEINEACSSGCGSFIEGFANTLGYKVADFSKIAIESKIPYDLGSRCTVFMNSKVKQALRDGATISDLSAGLAYSVVKNCLNKVLKIQNLSDIGDNIVVQGGTFRNEAVLRALELLSGKNIVISDKPELMGAYGAALYAIKKQKDLQIPTSSFTLDCLDYIQQYKTTHIVCKGCTNKCTVTKYDFYNGEICYSGNKCEKIFHSNENKVERGKNIFEVKKEYLFSSENEIIPHKKKIRIGIPRILNMYENFPFWNTLFTRCGLEVELSDESTFDLYKKGHGSIMSDNICFPAKLSHGHIFNLIEKNVDRIFFPLVIFEKKSFEKSSSSFSCPVITGYSEVLKSIPSSIAPLIPFDSPGINFSDEKLLKKACFLYLKQFKISKSVFEKAFTEAVQKAEDTKIAIFDKNLEFLNEGLQNKRPIVLISSHPYHVDQLIHQQVSQILADMGVYVINEEIASFANIKQEGFDTFITVAQWEYPNRILQAAYWASKQKADIGFIQLNSFGCGPDSFIMDEISEMMKRCGKSYSLLRIDEIVSPGSIKLRLRSLVESLSLRNQAPIPIPTNDKVKKNALFLPEHKERSILVPWFSDIYSPFIPALAKIAGYTMINLPPSDKGSIEMGLNFANNEICYPATLVVGDIIKALKSGIYDESQIAVGMTQTGGQCRATNYISLIKRALNTSGFEHIPVISVTSGEGLHNEQPGFEPKWKKALLPVIHALLYTDGVSKMYYSIVSRESKRGSTQKVRDLFIEKGVTFVNEGRSGELYSLLKEAVDVFNKIDIIQKEIPSVGIVGEIYIKYNSFGQFNTIDWLIENRVEVVIPPLTGFFMQTFINTEAYQADNIKNSSLNLLSKFGEWALQVFIYRYERALSKFRYYYPTENIRTEAKLASEILSLSNQYGEGWLISAEIASMTKQNVQNIICMQPFGCIANHIIGKGIEKKIKTLYPKLNLLFLDFDYGISKVNVLNRLQFLIQNQEIEVEKEEVLTTN